MPLWLTPIKNVTRSNGRVVGLGTPSGGGGGGGTISYTETAWNTVGTVTTGNNAYKDVTVSGASAGDLIVAFGSAEGNSGTTGSVATQSGSTGAWTSAVPGLTSGADVAFRAGYAAVTGTGSVTVRVTLLTANGATNRMGVGAFLIPASLVGGTYGFIGSGFNGDADGQTSATTTGTATVLYMAGDWSAGAVIGALTPAGGTIYTNYTDTTNYGVLSGAWTGRTAGTTNYGPSGVSGRDYSGIVFAINI